MLIEESFPIYLDYELLKKMNRLKPIHLLMSVGKELASSNKIEYWFTSTLSAAGDQSSGQVETGQQTKPLFLPPGLSPYNLDTTRVKTAKQSITYGFEIVQE